MAAWRGAAPRAPRRRRRVMGRGTCMWGGSAVESQPLCPLAHHPYWSPLQRCGGSRGGSARHANMHIRADLGVRAESLRRSRSGGVSIRARPDPCSDREVGKALGAGAAAPGSAELASVAPGLPARAAATDTSGLGVGLVLETVPAPRVR